MRNLAPLPDDPLEVYDMLVGARKKKAQQSRLRGVRERVACAYLRYYARKPHLERLRPLGRRVSALEADDLRDCYSGSRNERVAVHDRFYAKIRALSYKCAYCSMGDTETLDHYLPKDGKRGYPEFAILPVNLVPSCYTCNPSRDFRDKAGRRALIHPYFDRILQERLLIADVRVENGVPEAEFRVEPSGCSDPAFGQLYERHVRLLGLLKRFRDRAMLSDDGLYNLVDILRSMPNGTTCKDAAMFLENYASQSETELGANHYKIALLRGAAASSSFLDFCLKRTP